MPRSSACAALLLLACTAADAGRGPASGRGRSSLEAESLWVVGDSIYWTGSHDSAHALWTRALSHPGTAADSSLLARILTSLGMAERQLGDYAAARRHGEAALTLKRRLPGEQDLFTSYNALGLLAWNEGRLDDAARLLDSAGRLARAADDATQLTKVANNLALVRTERGDFDAARAGFAEARVAARAAGSLYLEGNALTNDAMLDIREGHPERAVRSLVRARQLYREAEYVAGEVSALGQLGVAFQAMGDFPGAFSALDTALALSRRHQLRQEEASNLEAIADAHHVAGDGRRALALYREAAAIDRELGLTIELGSNLRQTGLIHAELGERRAAMRQALAALAAHRDAGAANEELRDLLFLAELESHGNPQAAERRLAEAAELANRLGVRTSRVELALAEARHAIGTNHPERALDVLRKAGADLAAGGYDMEWQAQDLLAAAWVGLGQLDSALAAGRRAVDAVERVRGKVGSGELRTAYLSRRSAAYERLAGILIRLNRAGDALGVADALRGRALLEHLVGVSAGPATASEGGRREALLARIGALAARVADLEAVAIAAEDSTAQRVRTAATAELLAARSQFEALQARGARAPAATRARLDLRALRKTLRQGEAILEYLVRPESVELFVVTRDTVRHVASPIAAASLRTRVRLARDLAADPATPAERALPVFSGLRDILIAPAERAGHLRGVSRLTIVPHGGLAYLPFAALVDRESGRYMVQDYVIRMAASAAVLAERSTAPRAGTRRSPALAVAPFPDSLPGSRAELQAVARAHEGATLLAGPAATERRLRSLVGSAAVVHLATHAELNRANPLFSRIDLRAASEAQEPGSDGRLEVHEILELELGRSLVFLSGCETGLGAAWSTPFELGEDYTTLTQAFLRAGAGGVIGTLWRVRDDGAAALADAFYARLPGAGAADALADAQRLLLADSRWSSLYHWAGYTVSGD